MKFLFLTTLIAMALVAMTQTASTQQDTVVPKKPPVNFTDSSKKIIEDFRQKMDSGTHRVDSIIKSDTFPRRVSFAKRRYISGANFTTEKTAKTFKP